MSTTGAASTSFDPTDEWFRRPDVWSGIVLGAAMATRSFGPSLMPRKTGNQALVSGASAAAGFAIGNATYGVVGSTFAPEDQAAVFAATGAAGLLGSLLVREQAGEELDRAVLRSIGQSLAAGSAACGGVALVRGARDPLRAGLALGAVGAGLGAISVFRDLRHQIAALDDVDPPPPRALPALGQSVTVAGVLAAVVNGYRRSGRSMSDLLQRRFGLSRDLADVGGRVGATVAWGAVGAAFADTFVRGMALYDRVMDPGYDRPPLTAKCSGGPGSCIEFSRIGRQGRRFIGNVPTREDIAEVMGTPALAEPIRIFIGYDAASKPEERVALALRELERTRAYDRAVLVVGSPAGTGYVDTVPFETVDYLSLGDCAGVCVQYERLPSLLAIQRVGVGAHHYRLLLEGIHAALQDRAPTDRPRVVLYGESLGCWAGQDALMPGGLQRLDELGIDRALFAGTPFYSGWMRNALAGRTAPPGAVIEVDSPDELERLDDAARRSLRVVLLSHDNDPVRKLTLDLLVKRPDWLQGQRPPGVSDHQRYAPVVTAIQTIVDTANATNQVPGVFRAVGHDYRLDLPAATLAAYCLDRPTPEVWSRLMAKLQGDEAARAARFRRPNQETEEGIEATAVVAAGAS
jgi:uncharacterized membrane protein